MRITATNDYGTSSASEENVNSAVYQGEPTSPYEGAITVTQSGTTAVITWEEVALAKTGYSGITGWVYGY